MTERSDGRWITDGDDPRVMAVPDDPETASYYNEATHDPVEVLRRRVQELTTRVFELEAERDAMVRDGQEMLREIERLERSDVYQRRSQYHERARLAANSDEDYS